LVESYDLLFGHSLLHTCTITGLIIELTNFYIDVDVKKRFGMGRRESISLHPNNSFLPSLVHPFDFDWRSCGSPIPTHLSYLLTTFMFNQVFNLIVLLLHWTWDIIPQLVRCNKTWWIIIILVQVPMDL